MYTKHRVFNEPADPNACIWRYQSLSKFISTVAKRALFFSRFDKLQRDDPYEGSVPLANIKSREEILARLPPDRVRSTQDTIEALWDITYAAQRGIGVNCWHVNDHESMAMWKLYGLRDDGVAIRSTFGRLCRSVQEVNEDVLVGLVNYLDYEDPHGEVLPHDNALYPVMHKRKSFEHERELRAVIVPVPNTAWAEFLRMGLAGIDVPVNLDVLVEEVRVAPAAAQWFSDVVREVVSKFGLTCPVELSSLDVPPYWHLAHN